MKQSDCLVTSTISPVSTYNVAKKGDRLNLRRTSRWLWVPRILLCYIFHFHKNIKVNIWIDLYTSIRYKCLFSFRTINMINYLYVFPGPPLCIFLLFQWALVWITKKKNQINIITWSKYIKNTNDNYDFYFTFIFLPIPTYFFFILYSYYSVIKLKLQNMNLLFLAT